MSLPPPGSIVFCTTCKNRTAHLRQTLPQNLIDNPKSRFVIVNYNTQDDLPAYVAAQHAKEVCSGRLVLYSHFEPYRFRMAHAKNMAHRLGVGEGAEILVNLDADNLTGPGFEDFIARAFTGSNNIFLWARMIKGEMMRGMSGRIAVTRHAFLKAGGYDEAKFAEWGPDDKDFNLRVRMLGYDGVEIDPSYLRGIRHNDKIRFKEYPHRAQCAEDDDDHEVNKGTITQVVVNNGAFGCGTVFRNDDFTIPVALAPLPTRIFGIGMHKTATTSLHRALEILGYESWHWSSAHAAKAIWREMNNGGRSVTLENFYALSDLPIPLLYKQLDIAYPGSKFILTIRDEQNWVAAVKRHWDPSYNKYRSGWDNDPFSNRIHQMLYGTSDFDAETFLSRYRRHNAEVLEYFRGRPADLLVMEMDNGAGWRNCAAFLPTFLAKAIPCTAYPYIYRSGIE